MDIYDGGIVLHLQWSSIGGSTTPHAYVTAEGNQAHMYCLMTSNYGENNQGSGWIQTSNLGIVPSLSCADGGHLLH